MSIILSAHGQVLDIPTRLDFHDDSYQTSAAAYVDNFVEDERFGCCAVLSNTIFYPQGGGQKGDRGSLSVADHSDAGGGTAPSIGVVDTRKSGDCVLHVLDQDSVKAVGRTALQSLVGSEITMRINWDFRLRQMRLHSIAHLLHFFTEKVLERPLPYPSSSDLTDGAGVNRYDEAVVLPHSFTANVLEKMSEYLQMNIPISTYSDEARAGFRYWKCGNYIVPCGGTHLRNTSEVGPFNVDASITKGKLSIKFSV
ncbi:MAG: hypothetical protein JF606_28100 [Burkholderiales bacterium]|nr:hypothetical protein [Burkholderiales bacterium]